MFKLRKYTSTGKRRSLGQGMTEYIIIVALIALAAIAVYSLFGKTVRSQVGGMAQELAGTTNTGRAQAKTAADASVTSAGTEKGLGNYADDAVTQ
ncbi:MAG: membrane protein [Gammaproteobacteria bacterium]|nr:MAG: membrane protein [Gammaproteobacteria bacterium]